METERVVIVGAGHAGVECAAELRSSGYRGKISVFSSEDRLPYQRPPLSKGFIGGGERNIALLRSASFYEHNDIGLFLGCRVVGIDIELQTIEVTGGRTVGYDSLVLATGSRNRPLPVDVANGVDVCDLRSAEQALELYGALRSARSVGIIGAGFIGLEVASASVHNGAKTVVCDIAPCPMGRVLSPLMSNLFAALHAEAGVVMELGQPVRCTRYCDGRVEERHTTGIARVNGDVEEVDVVLAAVGAVANVELAAAAGLETARGVVTDGRLRCTAGNVYAIGDCAEFPDSTGGRMVRLESIQNAVDQARFVAHEIAGRGNGLYAEIPWFWTEQLGHKLQIAGLYRPGDELVRRQGANGSHSIFAFRNGVLSAVESLDSPRDHMSARRLLRNRRALSPEQVMDPTFDLKEYSLNK